VYYVNNKNVNIFGNKKYKAINMLIKDFTYHGLVRVGSEAHRVTLQGKMCEVLTQCKKFHL